MAYPAVVVSCSCAGGYGYPPPGARNGGGGGGARNGAGKGGARPDPEVTPKGEAETEAVRELLRTLRKKGEDKKGDDKKEDDKKGDDKKGDDKAARARGMRFVSISAQPARVTVRLPADARLFINGELCPLTSSTRSFNTPTLQPGKEYSYTLRMEVTRNGVRRVQTQRVAFSAGRQVTVDFNDAAPLRTARR
jgi:uncharacterized protein (TIGR03000 family)